MFTNGEPENSDLSFTNIMNVFIITFFSLHSKHKKQVLSISNEENINCFICENFNIA